MRKKDMRVHKEHNSSSQDENLHDDIHREGDLLVVSYLDNLCSMIINSESCVNVAIERLVKKLVLPIFEHPRPYKLQCLSERGKLLVGKQVMVVFTLGGYKDKVTCDVVPMKATSFCKGSRCKLIRR
ncbi:hypothetical protein CR513_00557, partial [Mucuna pruriens]